MTEEKTVVTITRTCDCCGKKVEEFANCENNRHSQALNITSKVVKREDHRIDLCQECNDEIIDFIYEKGGHNIACPLGNPVGSSRIRVPKCDHSKYNKCTFFGNHRSCDGFTDPNCTAYTPSPKEGA